MNISWPNNIRVTKVMSGVKPLQLLQVFTQDKKHYFLVVAQDNNC